MLFERLPHRRLAAEPDVPVGPNEVEALAPGAVTAVQRPLGVQQHPLLAGELRRGTAIQDSTWAAQRSRTRRAMSARFA